MAHDLNHGGEISMTLGVHGIENFELGDMDGHHVFLQLWGNDYDVSESSVVGRSGQAGSAWPADQG